MSLGCFLNEVRKNKNISLRNLALLTGLSKSTISEIENDINKNPTMNTLSKIAKALSIPEDKIIELSLQNTAHSENATNDRENSSGYSPMTIQPINGRIIKLPVLGKIPAGVPVETVENIIDYVEVPEDEVKNGSYFYLQVTGNSMIGSRIHEGDRVLVKCQKEVESGEIAVVRVNSHDATLKRVKKIDGQTILYPDNPNYDPIFVREEGAEIIGKVIKVEFDPNKKY